MHSGARTSVRSFFLVFAAAIVALTVLPVGVEAAGPALMRLVDGDGTARAQVDNGRIRVGDGSGAMTVDGGVRVTQPVTVKEPVTVDGAVGVDGPLRLEPARLLKRVACATSEIETTIDPGTVVTSIFLTGSVSHSSGARLDIYEGAKSAAAAVMSLKVSGTSEGDNNAVYSSDAGFAVTGAQPWALVCGGTFSPGGTNGALFSIFGYPPS